MPRAVYARLHPRRALALLSYAVRQKVVDLLLRDFGQILRAAIEERRPQVPTPDGVKEFRNRRVEIFSASGPAF